MANVLVLFVYLLWCYFWSLVLFRMWLHKQSKMNMLLFSSELLLAIGATHIESVGDSLSVVHQVYMDFMCFDESLNIYLDKCLDIISILACFGITHIFRHDIEEQMSWHNRHLAIMLIMVYFILLKSRCWVCQHSEGRTGAHRFGH